MLWRADARLGRGATGVKRFFGKNPEQGTAIHYYLRQPARGSVDVAITDLETGEEFRRMDGPGEAGMNRVQWDLRGNSPRPAEGQRGPLQGPLATAGAYRVTLTVNGRDHSRVVHVVEDVWMDQR